MIAAISGLWDHPGHKSKSGAILYFANAAAVQHYTDAPEWKKKQNIFSKYQILFYPMVKLGEKLFHLSTQAAGLMAKVDTDNGDCPCESASNKNLQANSAVVDDGAAGEEMLLDPQQANYLNSQGIVTALINSTRPPKIFSSAVNPLSQMFIVSQMLSIKRRLCPRSLSKGGNRH